MLVKLEEYLLFVPYQVEQVASATGRQQMKPPPLQACLSLVGLPSWLGSLRSLLLEQRVQSWLCAWASPRSPLSALLASCVLLSEASASLEPLRSLGCTSL